MPWGFAKAFEIDTVESRRQREVTKFGNFENVRIIFHNPIKACDPAIDNAVFNIT